MQINFDVGLIEDEPLGAAVALAAQTSLEGAPLVHFLGRVLLREHVRRASAVDAPPERDFELPFEDASDAVVAQFRDFCALVQLPLIERGAVLAASFFDLLSALTESELEARARRRSLN